jgi:hypothetical protein
VIIDQLKAAYEAARIAVRENKTPETMEAVVAAGAALSAAIVATGLSPKPIRGRGNRAGQRQAAERQAIRLAALRRAA